jgi:hypothetical protein
MDWIDLAQNRDRSRALVNAVMNLRVPQNAGNFFTNREPAGFSRSTGFHGVSTSINFEGHINFNKSTANEYAVSNFCLILKTLYAKKK